MLFSRKNIIITLIFFAFLTGCAEEKKSGSDTSGGGETPSGGSDSTGPTTQPGSTSGAGGTTTITAPAISNNSPAIVSPVTNPHTSNQTSLTISGNCGSAQTVQLSGDGSATTPCNAGTYEFSTNQPADGTYHYQIMSTASGIGGSTSLLGSLTWILDTQPPAAPSISLPMVNPFTSSGNSLNLSGTCEAGATLTLSGASNSSASCSGGNFSFDLSQSTDATYTFQITQKDVAGNVSAPASFQWIRTSAGVPPPTITDPNTPNFYSNASHLTLSGSCVSGNTVIVSGDDNQSAPCSWNSYTITINKTIDANYNFNLVQQDGSGNISPQIAFNWTRDTVAPSAPVIDQPTSNPYVGLNSNLNLTGFCEPGGTVVLYGDSPLAQVCDAGTFSFNLIQSADGTYDYSLLQTDRAGNGSATVTFQWIRDSSAPPTPVITQPAAPNITTNTSSMNIQGSCVTGYAVTLFDGITEQNFTCSSNTFNYSVNQTADGTYFYSIWQSSLAGIDSNSASLIWTRDTLAPAAPAILSPSTNPFVSSGTLNISGTCEIDAIVHLTGDATQQVVCNALGNFTLSPSIASDGTYIFQIYQSDSAGNDSGSQNVTWTRDSSTPDSPTIASPSINPVYSNGDPLTIYGGCITGYTVTLSGDVLTTEVLSPVGNFTQICTNSSYTFTVGKSLDGTYQLGIKQTSLSQIDSATTSLQWIRDTVVPSTTITSAPANPNFAAGVNFSFISDDPSATFECSLDGGAYSSCSSPHALSNVPNGSHTLSVRAVDDADNKDGTPATTTWMQAFGKAVALYHMNVSAPSADSSLFTMYPNSLVGTLQTDAGKFGTSLNLTGTVFPTVTDNVIQDIMTTQMTVESFLKLKTLPTGYASIVSKWGNSGQFSWEFGIRYSSNTYKLYLKIGYNLGKSSKTIFSSALTAAQVSALTAGFNHVAATWNSGAIAFYFGGTLINTTSTTVTSTLFKTTIPPLRIGTNIGGNKLNGWLDELRISQTVRWSSSFTVPTAEYSGD